MTDIPRTIVVAAGFVALLCAVYLIAGACDRYRRRLAKRISGEATVKGVTRGAMLTRLLPSRISQHVQNNNTADSKALAMAGYRSPLAPTAFLAARTVTSILPLMVGWAIVGFTTYPAGLILPWSAIAACLGFFAPKLYLKRAIARRHRVFCRTLPDFLDLLNVCLDSGLSVQAALKRIQSEINLVHQELAGELTIVQQDMELGANLDAAFLRFAERTGYEAIRTLSALVRESRRLGTPMGQAMKALAEMLRSQREQAAEEYAQKASVRILLPVMLLIFPAIFVVVAGPAIIEIFDAFSPE